MRGRVLVVGIVSLLGIGAVSAQALPDDPNQGGSVLQRRPGGGSEAAGICASAVPTVPQPDALAIVIARQSEPPPGLVLEIWNLGSGRIDHLIVDGFEAMDDQGICFHAVDTDANPGPVGIRSHYPNAREGVGPLVVNFDGFETNGCAAFATVCGTWCHPDYRPRVSDLVGTEMQLVFSNDLRGKGRLQRCRPSMQRTDQGYDIPCLRNDGVALIFQSYPRRGGP